MWGSERTLAWEPPDAKCKRSLRRCGHPAGPLFQRPAAPGSPISCPDCPLPLKSSSRPSRRQRLKPFVWKVQAPIFSVFTFWNPEAQIHPFHTPVTPLFSWLSRKLLAGHTWPMPDGVRQTSTCPKRQHQQGPQLQPTPEHRSTQGQEPYRDRSRSPQVTHPRSPRHQDSTSATSGKGGSSELRARSASLNTEGESGNPADPRQANQRTS